jgi:type II secretory pathway pseudopilin PulG
MMLNRLGLITRNQRGITVIELIIAVALSGIIVGATTATILQVINGSNRTSNQMAAVRQVQNAGYWVSHDAQMAQSVNTTAPDGFPITLSWVGWSGNTTYEVVYSSENMTSGGLKNLQRSYSVNGSPPDTIFVAQYVDPAATSANFTGGELIFTVTATVGTGSQAGSETRFYKVVPRPG